MGAVKDKKESIDSFFYAVLFTENVKFTLNYQCCYVKF